MTNNSSTGGFLTPNSTAPLEGAALEDFIGDTIAGITGLDRDTLVLPRWQPEPPNIAAAGICWVAFGFQVRPSDNFPYIGHVGGDAVDNPDAYDQMQRNEIIDCLCSFYGLGGGSDADKYAALLRDGLMIAQNREALMTQGFSLTSVEPPLPVPSLLKERWLYRSDLLIHFRRNLVRQYPVLNIGSAEPVLEIQLEQGGDTPLEIPINVQEE